MTSARSLHPLFSPGSVAVVGASEDPRKWGNWLARGALRGAHRRPVYLVNRRAGELLGARAYPSLGELPGPAELVVIAVPWAVLPAAVDEALEHGARAIVAITASDGPADGAEAALARRVRAAGAVLLGPNCLGVMDAGESLELISNPLPPGSIGLISQSGNLALELALLAEHEGLGFSRFASLGNQADLEVTDLVRALTDHAATRLIALYVEDFRDGRAFAAAAAEAVATGKPVLVLAIEHTAATARSVRSHTGALAADGAAIDAACRAAGVLRVRTPRELLDAAQALLRSRPAPGRRVAVLADGGGHATIAAAVAIEQGLAVPELSPEAAASLRDQLPPSAGTANPIDLAGAAERDVHAFDRVAGELLEGGEVDSLLITGYFGGYHEYGPEARAEELRVAATLGEVAQRSGRPIVAHTMYPRGPVAAALRTAGVPVYEAVEQAASALRVLAAAGGTPPGVIPTLEPAAAPVTGDGYTAARDLLAQAGVRFVAQRTVATAAEAQAAAAEIGYPVVLKALGQLHKSDAGGVALGLADPEALARAHGDMAARLAAPGYSVEEMAALGDGVELLIGARWDARFGPIALVGAGGLYAEILRDTAVALAPVSEADAEALLDSLRVASLLRGARGRPPVDVAAAAAVVASLSRAAAAHPELAELEINPLLVTPAGAIALDARFVRTAPQPERTTRDAVHLHA